MPNMKSIRLKTKELQSQKVDFIWQASWDHFLSLGAPHSIEKTSRHREYLLSTETLLLVAPLAVDSHFCQTGSAILAFFSAILLLWSTLLRKLFAFTWSEGWPSQDSSRHWLPQISPRRAGNLSYKHNNDG